MFSPAISPADPDLMMINCDMSAAYLSKDGGHNWRMIHYRQLRSDTRCRAAFHPTDARVIYASSGGQLRVSRDGGQTFSPLGDLKSALYGEIAIDQTHPATMLAGTRDGRCWISRDAGARWQPCDGPRGQLISFHFDATSDGKTMFAATDQGIWRSDDGGHKWSERTTGLPWKEIQGFAGGSNADTHTARLYCCVRSRNEQGKFVGGVYVSADRGDSWQSAMGSGINTETKQSDQWAYGPIAQYTHVLTTDANPLIVYATNTSTGFHPPHHETVFRSDDGGQTWHNVYFMDPRFERYNIAPDYVTASTGQSWKGGNAPFGVAICNSDPADYSYSEQLSHYPQRRLNLVFRRYLSSCRPDARAGQCLGLRRLGSDDYVALLCQSTRSPTPIYCVYRSRIRSLARCRQDVDLVGQGLLGPVAQYVL